MHATAWTTHGPVRVAGPIAELPQIFLPDPNLLTILGLQARLARVGGWGSMPDLLASLTAAPSGRATPVWFDSLAYCREKLLSGEPVPWASPGS